MSNSLAHNNSVKEKILTSQRGVIHVIAIVLALLTIVEFVALQSAWGALERMEKKINDNAEHIDQLEARIQQLETRRMP